jgi:hypothetical protein
MSQLALGSGIRRLWAQKPTPVSLQVGEAVPAGTRGAVAALGPGGQLSQVILGRPLRHGRAVIFSVSNANDELILHLHTERLRGSDWPYLVASGLVLSASTVGADDGLDTVTFTLSRLQADKLSRLLGVEPRLRRPLGDGLRASWRALGQRLILEIVNRQRTPLGICDQGLDLRVRTSDGRELTVREAQHELDQTRVRLEPGRSLALMVALDERVQLAGPGSYQIDCCYHAELSWPTASAGRWPHHAHEVWDWRATATVPLLVR